MQDEGAEYPGHNSLWNQVYLFLIEITFHDFIIYAYDKRVGIAAPGVRSRGHEDTEYGRQEDLTVHVDNVQG